MPDLTQAGDNWQKKTRSVSSAYLSSAAITDNAVYNLFELPANSLITDAYVVKKTAGAANLTADFGFDGGAELINDADLDDLTTVKDAGLKLDTGSGKSVTVKFSAAPANFKGYFVVEYIEYTLKNGMLTNYKPE